MLIDFKLFTNRIKQKSVISTPQLNSYFNYLNSNIIDYQLRTLDFIRDPIPSTSLDLINSFLMKVDINYLLKFPNCYNRIIKISNECQSPLFSTLIKQLPLYTKCFIQNKNKFITSEFIIFDECGGLLEQIPDDPNSMSNWMKFHPTNMIMNNSMDLDLNIISSRFKYILNPPTECIFTINLIKLILLFTQYKMLTDNKNNLSFIFDYCFIPMLKDNIKCWFLTYIINKIHAINENKYFEIKLPHTSDKSNFVLYNLKPALNEIDSLIEKCISSGIDVDQLIMSLKLDENTSILSYINDITDNHSIASQRNVQYRWLEFIRDYQLLDLMFSLYKLQPKTDRYEELKWLASIIFKRYDKLRFWNNAGYHSLAVNIQQKYEYIKSLISDGTTFS